MSKSNFSIFRYITVPISLASLGIGIAAADMQSSNLMFTAAGIGAAGMLSLALQKGLSMHSNGASRNGSSGGVRSAEVEQRPATVVRR
jgi:hypothetical protein